MPTVKESIVVGIMVFMYLLFWIYLVASFVYMDFWWMPKMMRADEIEHYIARLIFGSAVAVSAMFAIGTVFKSRIWGL